jgi:hypothetical protein
LQSQTARQPLNPRASSNRRGIAAETPSSGRGKRRIADSSRTRSKTSALPPKSDLKTLAIAARPARHCGDTAQGPRSKPPRASKPFPPDAPRVRATGPRRNQHEQLPRGSIRGPPSGGTPRGNGEAMRHAGEPRGNPRRSRQVGERGGSLERSLGSGCSEFTAAGIGGWVEDSRVPAVVVGSRFWLGEVALATR